MKMFTLCYVRKNGKILMLHRVKKKGDVHEGKWNGLGDKLEKGESPEECVKREVFEESGLKVKKIFFKGVLTFPEFAGGEDWYVFLFTAGDFSGRIRKSSEGNLAWIKNRDLLKLNLWEGDRHFLKYLGKEGFVSGKFRYKNGKLGKWSISVYPAPSRSSPASFDRGKAGPRAAAGNGKEKRPVSPGVFAVCGEINSGKTGFLKKAARRLARAGFAVGGVLAEKRVLKSGKRIYTAVNLETGKKAKLLSVHRGKIKEFKGGMDFARGALETPKADLIVADEFGPLEASGGGMRAALEKAARRKIILVSVRKGLRENLRVAFTKRGVSFCDMEDVPSEKKFCESVLSL